MNKKIIWSFLILLIVVATDPAFSGEIAGITHKDSLRKEITIKKGPDKISAQLELALLIMDKDAHEAMGLADSALSAATSGNRKNLEMRAYFVLGRINEVLNNKNLSEIYYDKALIIAETLGDNWYKGEILYRKGVIKHNRGEEINALEYLNASLQACRLSNNFKTIGSSYSLMGTIFRINGLYDRAIEYIVNAKLNYEKAEFSEGKAWSSYLLGRIYSDLKLPQKALDYFQDALQIYTKQAAIDGNEDGLALCYEQIGLINLDSGNFEEAHKYIDQTMKIYAASESKYGVSTSYKNLGMIEYSRGNYDLAEKYLHEAIKINKEVGDLLSLPTMHEYLGLCLIGKGQTKEGLKSLNHGLTLAITNNQKKIQLNIYSKLTEVYLSINDLRNAVSCQKKQIEIQDQILSGAANIKIEQLQAIYEIDKKNRQILELEKQNEINSLIIKQHRFSQLFMIIGIFIAFLVSVSMYWFYNKLRHKNLELKETNAAKDKFFAIIAHDLRGPTGNLAAFLEHLNETYNDHSPKELKKILLSLYKSAESVSVLLENLLIWAQSQLNKIEFNPRELKLTDIIQNSIHGLLNSAETKQIDIRYEFNDQIFVFADQDMVQTIVRNLLSNAIKFTPRGGSIIIKTDIKDTNNALVRVIDNGIGMEQSELSRIFDINNTFHTSGTEGEMSTGLGLILVKDFIDKNNGTITIESQKDKGTVVSFTLPTAQGNNS
jgi:signal transduction histidine kinase